MKKTMSALALAGIVIATQQAYAVVTSQGFVEGHVTSVSVSDRSVENGASDSDLQITFDVAGTECGASRAAGVTFNIHRSDQATGTFDNFVKTAQAAYLSGKTLRYSTAKSSSTSACFAYYMQLK